MSHISVIKTHLKNREFLIRALEELGYRVVEGDNLSVQANNRKKQVDFLIEIPYSDPIGFRDSKNGYQIVADWFKVLTDRNTFRNQLVQKYTYLYLKSELDKQGFEISHEDMSEKNQIHLVVRRTV